jgi:hypothetical protein
MSKGTSFTIYSYEALPELGEGEAAVRLADGNYVVVDSEVAAVLVRLINLGLTPLWSCAGGPGHMCQRPTIIVRRDVGNSQWWERDTIALALASELIERYWISHVRGYGAPETQPAWLSDEDLYGTVWLVEWPGPYDFLPLPIAFSSKYMSETEIEVV